MQRYKHELHCLFIAADSIADAINSSGILYCDPKNELSPNPDSPPAGFELDCPQRYYD